LYGFQVLSLGAGFDTTYFQLSQRYGGPDKQLMTYFEVDLGSNVERKAALIRRSNKCSQYLGSDYNLTYIIK
jgi:O-methyltransferase involved in polyketide biosynthesis